MIGNMFRRGLGVFLIVIVGLMFAGADPTLAALDTPDFYHVNVDGSRSSLTVGSVVAQGVRVDNRCENLLIRVGGSGSNAISQTVIRGSVDENCTARIDNVEWERDSQPRPMPPPGATGSAAPAWTTVHLDGFARATLIDGVGITLAATEGRLEYHDDRERLSDGRPSFDCNEFRPTGWEVVSCDGSNSTAGSQYWFSRASGEYFNPALDFIPNTRVWSSAEYDAWPGGWTYSCEWTIQPPGTIWQCRRYSIPRHTH